MNFQDLTPAVAGSPDRHLDLDPRGAEDRADPGGGILQIGPSVARERDHPFGL